MRGRKERETVGEGLRVGGYVADGCDLWSRREVEYLCGGSSLVAMAVPSTCQ